MSNLISLRCRKNSNKIREKTQHMIEPSTIPSITMDKLEKEIEANGIPTIIVGDPKRDKSTTTSNGETYYCSKSGKEGFSIKKSFYPLGLFAKSFGLFPCYDLNFTLVNNRNSGCPKMNLRNVLEYCYSGLFFLLIATGTIVCAVKPPVLIEGMKQGNETTDAIVMLTIFYMTMGMGVLSFFIFPLKFHRLLHYIDHFASIDKLLEFSSCPGQKLEHHFAIKSCAGLVLMLLTVPPVFVAMFILELPEEPKSHADYLVVLVEVIAVMSMVIPSSLLLFFLNGIRLRLIAFNKKLELLILPITPSCFIANCYSDFGSELTGAVCSRKSNALAEDLEKMRIIHQEISELASETSIIFGSHLLRYFFYSCVAIILYSYFIIFLREEDIIFWHIYPMLEGILVLKMLIVTSYCHSITSHGSSCRKYLQKVWQLRVPPECATQVQLFIKKLDNPIQITAYGFFTINHRLITSILGAITTYLIILVQFKITDKSAELKKWSSGNYSCAEFIELFF